MLTAVVSGLLCGSRGYKAIAEWLHDLPVDVWHWMGYTRRSAEIKRANSVAGVLAAAFDR